MKLSIVIPMYNEAGHIHQLLDRISAVVLPGWDQEVIIVDDGSTDGTGAILDNLDPYAYIIIKHARNKGKGAALRSGFWRASGDVVVTQDADLEYNPADFPLLLDAIVSGDADIVYGSRFTSALPRRTLYFFHYLANKFLTFLSNLFTGFNLSDMETGYKVFNRKAIDALLPHLVSNRFGIEPEITARAAKHNLRVYEVGISYRGRTYSDGKKITWLDGVAAIWHIIRFNLFIRR